MMKDIFRALKLCQTIKDEDRSSSSKLLFAMVLPETQIVFDKQPVIFLLPFPIESSINHAELSLSSRFWRLLLRFAS